jgi:hypothetical protein
MSIILANRGDEQKIIEEEKEEWIYQVLIALGIPEKILVDLDNEEVVEYIASRGIEVFTHLGIGKVEIWKDGQTIAEWREPKLIMKKDKEYYYEIHLNEWALPFQQERKK